MDTPHGYPGHQLWWVHRGYLVLIAAHETLKLYGVFRFFHVADLQQIHRTHQISARDPVSVRW
jgi:hypothetical protein